MCSAPHLIMCICVRVRACVCVCVGVVTIVKLGHCPGSLGAFTSHVSVVSYTRIILYPQTEECDSIYVMHTVIIIPGATLCRIDKFAILHGIHICDWYSSKYSLLV